MGGGANFGKKGKDKYDIDFWLRIILVAFFLFIILSFVDNEKRSDNYDKNFW